MYKLYVPYSAVVNNRVNNGTVIVDMPFCIMLQNTNHRAAFVAMLILL